MDATRQVRVALRNLLLAAVVFIPVFLIASAAELKVRGVVVKEPISYWLSGHLVVYLGLVLPVLFGAIAHSTCLLLIPGTAAESTRRILNLAFALLLPLTVIFSGWAPILLAYPGSTAIATLVYAVICATSIGIGPASKDTEAMSRIAGE